MRIACIIMAHKGPQQIERYIKKFNGLPFDFFIHIDKKINIQPFEYLADLPRVNFVVDQGPCPMGFVQLYSCNSSLFKNGTRKSDQI